VVVPLQAAEPAAPIGPSAVYQRMYRPEGPWAIHVVEADLSDDYLQLHALMGGGATMARKALSDISADAETEEARPIAAVNADFFSLAGGSLEGVPLGVEVTGGELVTFPDPARTAFCVLDDGTMHIDRLREKAWLQAPGDILFPIAGLNRPPGFADLVVFTPRVGEQTRAEADTTQIALVGLTGPLTPNSQVSARVASVGVGAAQRIPPQGAVLAARGVAAYALRKLKPGDDVTLRLEIEGVDGEIREAVSGGPRLVRDGTVSVESLRERFSNGFAAARHPRTGLGLRGSTLVMVAVDGRQPGYSEGMTLDEFARLFVELGCTDAMNLDGGGSTTLVVRNRVMNSPSGGWQRAVVNGLGLFSAAPLGPPVQLAIEPRSVTILSGERMALIPTGIDEHYNPVPVDPGKIRWEVSAALGWMSDHGVLTAAPIGRPTVGLVMAELGDLKASAVVTVTPAPARVVVTPALIELDPGGSQQFIAQAYDADNKVMQVSPGRLVWWLEPAVSGAKIDQSGRISAGKGSGSVRVVAEVNGRYGEAEAIVGAEPAVVEDFEGRGQWSYRAEPASAPGAVEQVPDPLKAGNRCLKLSYDFSQGTGTRTAYAMLQLRLPETRSFTVSVAGDGAGGWLRAALLDGAGRRFTVDLASKVSWSGKWRELKATLPEEAESPLTLESIYLAEYHEDRHYSGAIWLDDIGAASLNAASAGEPAMEPGSEGRPEMNDLPTYVCRKTKEPVVVDGRLTEAVWSKAESLGDFLLADGSGKPQLPTEVKACWDDKNLYLAFVAIDTDIWGTMLNRDDPIYNEEVVEAFLGSCGDVTRYFEFEFSPHNTVFDAKIECPESGDRRFMKADTDWNCKGLESAVQVVGTLDDRSDVDERWTVEVALPFAEIGREGRPPADGEEWRANFYRIDRADKGEFSCWSPTKADPPNFHVPARYGVLKFSGQTP